MSTTIKRTITGAAAVGAAGTLLLGALPSDAATSTAAATAASTSTAGVRTVVAASSLPALKASNVRYVNRSWGCDPEYGCSVVAEVPKGWKLTKLSHLHAKFTAGSGTWMLRIDGSGRAPQTTLAAAKQKQRALRGVRGLKILSVTSGTIASRIEGSPRVAFTTVTYTYRDRVRGTRWVATRYMDRADHGEYTQLEVTVSGRVKDQAALKAIQNRATQTAAQYG
jgi:hypothetical protein